MDILKVQKKYTLNEIAQCLGISKNAVCLGLRQLNIPSHLEVCRIKCNSAFLSPRGLPVNWGPKRYIRCVTYANAIKFIELKREQFAKRKLRSA